MGRTTCTSPIVSSQLLGHPSTLLVRKLRRKFHKISLMDSRILHKYLLEMKSCKKITISTPMRT
jgi:hypothetical protein